MVIPILTFDMHTDECWDRPQNDHVLRVRVMDLAGEDVEVRIALVRGSRERALPTDTEYRVGHLIRTDVIDEVNRWMAQGRAEARDHEGRL